MPPNVALLLGVLFVIGVFYLQRSRVAKLSSALFWPTLWYLVVASRPFGVWMSTWGVPMPGGSSDATEGSSVDRYFYLILTIVGIRILSRRSFQWGVLFRLNPCLTALLAYMAVSILWSDYSFVSFKRFVKVAGAIVMAMVVLTEDRPYEALLTVLRRCLYVHLPMSIICIKYFRDIGVAYDWEGTSYYWQGIATSKNTLGQMAMLGTVYFSSEIRKHWLTRGWRNMNSVYLIMAIYLLKGRQASVSMTSLSVGLLGIGVFFGIQLLRTRMESVRRFIRITFRAEVVLVTLVLVHSVVMFSEDSPFGYLITQFGRNITFTDRTYIWSDCYAAASGSPLFGVGFGGFWIGREANIPWNATMTWVLGQAHSGYVDTYLQLGFIGAFLLAAVLFTTMPRLLSSLAHDFDYACFRITLFIAIIYINMTETTYLRGDHHLWFLLQTILWRVPAKPSHLGTAKGRDEDPASETSWLPAAA